MTDRLRRRVLTSVCFLLAVLTSQAEAQPTKAVTLVVPYAAGGGTDTVARLIGEEHACEDVTAHEAEVARHRQRAPPPATKHSAGERSSAANSRA